MQSCQSPRCTTEPKIIYLAIGRACYGFDVKTTEKMAATNKISADIPDWTREAPQQFWDPGRKLLQAIRGYQKSRVNGGIVSTTLCRWFFLQHRFWTVVSGADIPLTCQIGGGLLIPHPNGIVIHPDAKIGVNCLIFQQVTVGKARNCSDAPQIGGHVDIGAGAKILGPVQIGAHSRIGANAVVTRNVEEDSSVVAYASAIGEPKALSETAC
jgi:serine O-acetyltransferase